MGNIYQHRSLEERSLLQTQLEMGSTITREMARHENLTASTGIKVYFADPHSPWQRGRNEYTNGLFRQYLPKSEDLSRYSQEELYGIAEMLNARPRKSLGWKAPAEPFLPKGCFDFQKFWSVKIDNIALGS